MIMGEWLSPHVVCLNIQLVTTKTFAQFSSRWYICAQESPCALHPIKFPQCCLWNNNFHMIQQLSALVVIFRFEKLWSFKGSGSGSTNWNKQWQQERAAHDTGTDLDMKELCERCLTFWYSSSSLVTLRMYLGKPIMSTTALAFSMAALRVLASIHCRCGRLFLKAAFTSSIICSACEGRLRHWSPNILSVFNTPFKNTVEIKMEK